MKAIFKFNKNGSGAAGFFSHGLHKKTGEIVLFLKIAKQTGWNQATNSGTCKNGEFAQVMLGQFENCGIAEAIETRTNWKTYHKVSGGAQSAISLDHTEGRGFSLKIFKGDKNYLVGLSYPEARLLKLSIEANLQLDAVQWFYRQPGENAAPQGEEAAGYEEN